MNSSYTIVRTAKEIEYLLNQAVEAEQFGTRYPAMTYEQGVLAAIRWLTEKEEPHPIDEE